MEKLYDILQKQLKSEEYKKDAEEGDYGMKTIELNSKNEKQLLELLDNGLAYDDEYYSNKIAKSDKMLFDNINNQLTKGNPIRKQIIERAMEENNTIKWEQFRDNGFLVFVNQFLHIFGYAIYFEYDKKTGKLVDVYPDKCKSRGFGEQSTLKAYKRLTKYMYENIHQLVEDATDDE